SLPIANRQLALAFAWKAARHVRPDGRVCLMLPHGVLFNHHEKALEFQREYLQRHAVDFVLNLADLRFNLFEEAVGPALVVRYSKGPPQRRSAIRYLVPKTDWSVLQAEILALSPEDQTEIALSEVLPDLKADKPALIWKERFWGTPRDWKLLDRLLL